jgi:hypothetical protein
MSPAEILKDEVLEALATLLNITVGDAYYKVQEGKFTELAVEALTAFTKNFHLIEKMEDSEPLEDKEILQNCLQELLAELQVAEAHDADPKTIAELKLDILGLRQRIKVENQE